MRLLLLGAGGMLGRAVAADAMLRGHVTLALARRELDITRSDLVEERLREFDPELVVNAAAFTQVDLCEQERERAFAVNAEAAGALARACAAAGARLVHVSTDYVFDGSATAPVAEGTPPRPLSVYGASKWAGEQQVLAASPAHLVVRTSALFGAGGPNFVDTIAARLRGGGEPLRVVSDQTTAPTFAPFLARALLDLGESRERGVMHYRNREPISWCDFARAIADEIGSGTPIEAATSNEVMRPARRPAYSVLAVEKFESVIGRRVEPWQEGLRRHLAGTIKERA